MQELISKMGSLYNELLSKSQELDKLGADLNAKMGKLLVREGEIKDLSEQLAGRESKIRVVEDILSAKKAAENDRKKANEEMDALADAREKFRVESLAVNNTITRNKQQLDIDREMLKKSVAILKDEQLKLKEEKENYKKKVLEEIGKKIK